MIFINKCKLFLLKIFIFLIIIIYCSFIYTYKKSSFINKKNINNFDTSRYISLNNYLLFNNSKNNINLILKDINYEFNYVLNISKISYKFGFFDFNKNLISPSELSLYNDLHVFCTMNLKNNDDKINSFANIYKNSFFECIEFFNINEKITFGIQIYQIESVIRYSYIYFFNETIINFNKLNGNKNHFFNIIKNKISSFKNFNIQQTNDNIRFRKYFLKYPIFILKKNILKEKNKWYFENIFNHYFCFCKGNSCLNAISYQKCKYDFYLYIIDNHRNIYNKTDYLFMDFILSKLSSDDTYPIFQRMTEQNLPVHYMTQNIKIYDKYCYKNKKCLTIIKVNRRNYKINGNYLENYLSLILKLKSVISNRGKNINYASHNFFRNLEYITYIGVGHGVSFFKSFLYSRGSTYGINSIDKLLIPPSDKLISVAKKYGWNDENIIKCNLPRWDKYVENQNISNYKNIISNNSLFVMFTWRGIRINKTISVYYFKNIINLVSDKKLYNILKNKNIILYFNIHHLLHKYINKYKNIYKNSKYIHFIEDNYISECLAKTNLVVSDFSSIIFDIIFRRKPFIIYVPDAYDINIKYIYKRNYYNLINSIKQKTINNIEFVNKFFNLNEAINKIIYYINNDFKLETKLQKFYDIFNLTNDKSINKFINYLKNI